MDWQSHKAEACIRYADVDSVQQREGEKFQVLASNETSPLASSTGEMTGYERSCCMACC